MRIIREIAFAVAALALVPALLAFTDPAHAKKRAALVISNMSYMSYMSYISYMSYMSYVHIPRLANLASDAKLIADTDFILVGSSAQLDVNEGGLRRTAPGETFKDCPECPEMVVVPAGSFTMGSPASEEGRTRFEGPQHRVRFSQPFAVGRFAVTFDEWDACFTDGGCKGYKPSDSNWGRGKRPVINVSWDDAQAYIIWLQGKTGRKYHLLSEAQREYVTRAGTTTPFWWGSSISTSQANYKSTHGSGRYQTTPVDSFQPNPWGLFQVHGNVGEWTEDCWNNSYSDPPTDGSAWTSGNCTFRVVRGGAWTSDPSHLRSAFRSSYISVNRNQRHGFRVARTL